MSYTLEILPKNKKLQKRRRQFHRYYIIIDRKAEEIIHLVASTYPSISVSTNSKKELPCAVCVFVYILKPGSCFLAFQFEEVTCSSNQISCACLESVQSSVVDSFKINITSPSYYIKCKELCHVIHLIVNNM